MDSDSDSDDETDHIGALTGEGDSDMELDEPDQRSVSMATGITHDHPYAWALDGRVASLNEGNALPGHIHVSLKNYAFSKTRCSHKNSILIAHFRGVARLRPGTELTGMRTRFGAH